MADRPTFQESQPPPVPLWMVTFSDTTGLLVCFFVMLIGFSAMEQEDRSRAPGLLTGFPGISEQEHIGNDAYMESHDASGHFHMKGYETPPEYDPLSYVREGFEARVRASTVSNALDYRLTAKGFEIKILPGQLFERDSSRLRTEARGILGLVGAACRHLPHPLRVQAYADDLFVPNEEFENAEALAMRRGAVVCSLLYREMGLPVERLSTGTSLDEDNALPSARDSQVTIVVLRAPTRRVP